MDAEKGENMGPVEYKRNINDDYYKDGVTIYADGLTEINVGGHVYGKSLSGWFEAAKELDRLQAENEKLKAKLDLFTEIDKTLSSIKGEY
jgi:hypothetical protein